MAWQVQREDVDGRFQVVTNIFGNSWKISNLSHYGHEVETALNRSAVHFELTSHFMLNFAHFIHPVI